MRRLLYHALLSGLLLAGGPAVADPIRIIAFPLEPFVKDDGGKAVGPGIDLVAELAKAAGLSTNVEIRPLPRALLEAENGDRIIAMVSRTSEREPKLVWIAESFLDGVAVATLTTGPRIDTVAAIKTLPSLVVRERSQCAEMLKREGTQNIRFAPRPDSGASMLAAGHVAGWCAPRSSIRAIWRNENLDESKLQVGPSLVPMPLWIAGSKNLPAEVIRKMTERYNAMKADGSYDKIFAEFR
jgi:ABC-type amino acid transport substrate-binding protein